MVLLSAAATLVGGCSDSTKPDAVASESPTARPSATVTPKPHTLVFKITGKGRLTSLTYVVNGKETTKKAVKLPWRKTIHLLAKAGEDTWRLRTQGACESLVTVDGEQVGGGGYCDAASCLGDDSGVIGD
ncbi:hypothetical protein GCM10022254_45960 [Actinomadura meridiana]|uniref:Uncharacterized protein n=1 Tax=Actinomadura meridiana TaxID=559626 RepID=A0ABP8CA41_9ACTN